MSISVEASILNSSYLGQSKHAVITLLNGKHKMQPYIELYPKDIGYIGSLPANDQPILEISILATPKHNALHIRTSNALHKPKRGDVITFYFEDNTSMDVELIESSAKIFGKMLAIVLMSDFQLSRLALYVVDNISIVNSKNNTSLSYYFNKAKTKYYNNAEEGKRLFREMFKSILGAKTLLINHI